MNPIAKLRCVFTLPKIFHKGTKGGSTRDGDSLPHQRMTRRLSSKIKRAVSWRPRRSRRSARSRRGAKTTCRDTIPPPSLPPPPAPVAPSPAPVAVISAVSADIHRNGSLYVADLNSLPRARTPPAYERAAVSENSGLDRSWSLPGSSTQSSDMQLWSASGPMRYQPWPVSPR
ncbi:hypothetical protein R1flu_004748 [Riccia fluitans]|uniref:Uncharacterized protein n=1 Tax=Riccia fluitans TaxID=41844 RepID=A0ABD1YS58_9MARC